MHAEAWIFQSRKYHLKTAGGFSHVERQDHRHASPKFAWASVGTILYWQVERASCIVPWLQPHTCHFEGVGKLLPWAVSVLSSTEPNGT